MSHGRYCSVPGCTGNAITFHALPKEPNTQRAWLMFINDKIPLSSFDTKISICSNHFTPDSFDNLGQFQAGFATRLYLKRGAVPTILPSLPQTVQGHSSRTRNVDCQCDIKQRSVGTQLSKGTLLSVRSKVTQTPAVTHVSLGDDMDFLLHPPQNFTLKESGDPKRSSSYMLGMQQYTMPRLPTVRNCLMADVIVSVASLLQLFQKCLKCCSNACSVTTETKGFLFHVVQQCWSCGNNRNWASHPPDQPADQPPPDHTPPHQQLPDQPSPGQQLPDPDTLEMTEPVGRAFKDICTEEEITGEEMVQGEEEDEEEEKQKTSMWKRRDSDEECTPNLREVLEVSDEEPGDVDEEEGHGLQIVWCCDCGEEAGARCFKQKHLQLYCCIKCGYRDGDQELVCTDVQQTQHTISPESPTAAEKEGSCDVSQAAELAGSPEANNNNEQTASSDRLEDSNRINCEGVISSASQHATISCIQKSTSNGVNELSSSCSIREQGCMGSSDQRTRNESPEDTSSRDQDSASQVESSNSCHQETSAANEEIRNPLKYAVYFNDPYSLQIHVEQFHGELCPDCGKFLIRRDSRTKHICDHKVKPFSCLVCGKRSINEVGLVHTEDRGLSCQNCYKKFRFQEDKQEREETLKGESLKYRCSECPKRFADRFSRSAHRKTHWKHGRFFCKVCNKGFPEAYSLKRHKVVHTGLKAYRCEVCDLSFNQSAHLKSHMRLHTGERPFKCQDCGQCFTHNVSLKNHIQRHHGPGTEGGREKIGDDGARGTGSVDQKENLP
ncbi:zinc finger protein 211-like [Sardina pilchardus]|uniref:zinc finger protein 211-like n=1 Tax=Sardina pilchardus TaxID=27697 RepID=UPI002E12F26F